MNMDGAAHAAMGMSSVPWTANTAVLMFLMWAIMMVAMMLPSAAPMVLTYAAVVGRLAPHQAKPTSVAVFAAAYLLVWLGFSVGATLLQWSLERAAILSPSTMALGRPQPAPPTTAGAARLSAVLTDEALETGSSAVVMDFLKSVDRGRNAFHAGLKLQR